MEGYREIREMYSDLPENLKDEQIKAIQLICEGKHVLGVLPTGFGKSLMFILPALMRNKMALIISPLKALMASQVAALNQMGIPAMAIANAQEMTSEDRHHITKADVKALFVSPESLEVWMDKIDNDVYRKKLCVLAFDEVHTLSEWGETFRPSFAALGKLRSRFETVPVLMLSATLTEEARSAVFRILHLHSSDVHEVFKYPDRPNINIILKYHSGMRVVHEMMWYFEELIEHNRSCPKCVVYINGSLASLGQCYRDIRFQLKEKAFCGDRQSRDELMVEVFHASLAPQDKERILKEFTSEDSKIRLLVASSAFGMGINISDIKYAVLWGAPSTLCEAWQEVGRVGRDGSPSVARLLFTPQSVSQHADAAIKRLLQLPSSTCIRKYILDNVFYKNVDEVPEHHDACCSFEKK